MKKSYRWMVMALMASLLLQAATPAFSKLSRLVVKNNTYLDIKLTLTAEDKDNDEDYFYYLTVRPGEHTFTLERLEYTMIVYACEQQRFSTLDMTTNQVLKFRPCFRNPAPPFKRLLPKNIEIPFPYPYEWWKHQPRSLY